MAERREVVLEPSRSVAESETELLGFDPLPTLFLLMQKLVGRGLGEIIAQLTERGTNSCAGGSSQNHAEAVIRAFTRTESESDSRFPSRGRPFFERKGHAIV